MSLTRRGFLGLTAGIGLAGCARGAGGQVGNFDHVDISTPSRYRNRPHQIVLWSTWSGVNGLALDGLLERFNQSQDQIYAQAQFQGSYAVSAPKLVAAMQARKVPDIMVLADTYWGRFLLSDTLEPLNPYFGSDFRQEDFVDELIGEGVTGGKLYWVSFARSTPLFYYNRDLFAKAGLPDRGPHTWTELREWGREITKIKVNGAATKVHAFTGTDDWEFEAATWQFGGRFSQGLDVRIGSGGAVDAGEWQRRFIFQDKMAYLTASPSIDFSNGLIATCMDSTGVLQTVYEAAKFKVGASPLPRQVTKGIPTGGSGFVIPKGVHKDRKAAAFEVIKFLSTPESSAEWSRKTGYLPVIKAAVEQPALAQLIKKDPNVSVAINQLPEARPSDSIRAFATSATEDITGGMQRIFGGNDPAGPVLSGVAKDLQRAADLVQDRYDDYYLKRAD